MKLVRKLFASQKKLMNWGSLYGSIILLDNFLVFHPNSQIQGTIKSLGSRGRIEVINLGKDAFLFKFENRKTKDWVLHGGP